MKQLQALKAEISLAERKQRSIGNYLKYLGYREHYGDPVTIARAYACASVFRNHKKKVFQNDLILGSRFGLLADQYEINEGLFTKSDQIAHSYGERHFGQNVDHFAPDYKWFLELGIEGILEQTRSSMVRYASDEEKIEFLKAAEITMLAFSDMILQYGQAAREEAEALTALESQEQKKQLLLAAEVCERICISPPATFREALQLVWFTYIAFVYEGRYAMAFGRMDQYLYPYYIKDIEKGRLTKEAAQEMIACALYKIAESWYFGGDDVVNIAIGGVKRDGSDAVNELTYLFLEAVKECKIAGPNLSARIHKEAPPQFLDACLQVIGTGIGYPALMNDEVNIAALQRYGYDPEDCRDYCMVGCIENFLPGQQPPWSDGRFNTPFYLELALNDGCSWQNGAQLGPHTGKASEILSMDAFLEKFHRQLEVGAAEYMAVFRNENDRLNKKNYKQPFLSCFCPECIERGLDINDGGTKYPTAHAPGCMGIATVADSLAAIEQVVFVEKKVTLEELCRALQADFVGYEELRRALLNAPKYGNNQEFVDKYAVWYLEEHAALFGKYKTPDGGNVYIAMASNTANIPAGKEVAATPDGRKCHEPLSDAASPMRGMDVDGPTSTLLSVSKPDYTKAACGTVLNQKYTPQVFEDAEKRARLAALIRVYFARGGQEIQINSVSRSTLQDAMVHPEDYGSLVVRVSGFSAFYVKLDPAIQKDILSRTEHE